LTPRGTLGAQLNRVLNWTHSEVVRSARMIRTNTRSELRVQLDPPELGRMKVEVEMRDGNLEVRIRVENPEVRTAIRNELADLERGLKSAQVDVSRFEVGDYQSDAGGERYQTAPRQRPYGSAAGSAADHAPYHSGTEDGWVRISATGRMDCLV
jgi:flagellar hook-length control protein FliK